MDRTTEYAKLVVNKKKIAGRKEYLACERHLQDLKRKNFDYKFNKELAEKAINIINELVIGEGEEQQKLSTRGFQNFIIGSLFGWVKKKTKERRFREAYIQVGRQNGKSILSGAMANQFATFSGYKLGRIFCAATKQEQANIVWDEIAKFIRSDNDLQEMYKITEHERTIKSFVTGNVIKSLGRDTKSADGFRSILAICDELHAHPNNQMYKLMLDGQINVDGALTLAITTAGFNLNGFCFEQYKFCEKVLEKVIDKESLFIFICEMDKDDDIWDYNNWAKSNPYLLFNSDNTINKDMVTRLAEKAIEAKEKGGADLLNFMTKHLNYWVTNGVGGFVDLQKFKECESDLSIEDMKGKKCYLGLDLSSGGDLTSIALAFPLENEKIYIYSHSFMPELRLAEHEKTDDVPYRIWVNKGLLTLTSGAFGVKTDYKFIINHLKELIEKYEIKIEEVGYDNHNASVFLQDLEFLACDLTEIKQSAKSLNDATVDFQLSVKANQLLYDKENDLLKWSIANATTTSNSFGEIKIDKQAQKYRIDPVDAVIDAWKIMLVNRNEYSADSEFDDWFEMIKGK